MRTWGAAALGESHVIVRSAQEGEYSCELHANCVGDPDVRKLAIVAERVDGARRNSQKCSDLADRQQPVSKLERKICQRWMTRGIVCREMSSIGDNLGRLASASDIPVWPFKPRVVGSIPTRLTLQSLILAGKSLGRSP